MRRIVLAALLAALVVAPAAAASAPTRAHTRDYNRLYRTVAKKFGARAPGRNIVRWGFASGRRASDRDVLRSIGVLSRALAPPPPPVAAPAAYPAASPPAMPTQAPTSYYGGGYSIPSSIVRCESGGNWSAVNSSSGAGGAYQVMPQTWAAYGGTGLPQDASPAEQSRIAAKIWAAQGASAWSCG